MSKRDGAIRTSVSEFHSPGGLAPEAIIIRVAVSEHILSLSALVSCCARERVGENYCGFKCEIFLPRNTLIVNQILIVLLEDIVYIDWLQFYSLAYIIIKI